LDASAAVAEKFESISRQLGESAKPKDLSHADQVLWYVVAVRCERDMEGLESVFDQLLDEPALLFLIRALSELQEQALALLFQRAHEALSAVNFYERPDAMCHEFGNGLGEELKAIDQALSEGDLMWQLDPKLLQLHPQATKP
jgi:hypothetical protein